MNARNRSATVIAVAATAIVLAATLSPPALATDGSELAVTDPLQATGTGILGLEIDLAWTLALLGTGVLAAAAVAVVRDPARLQAIPVLGTVIDRRHARWMDDGYSALFARNPEQAAIRFKRASTLKPQDPLACFEWAVAEYEADHPERCLELLDRAEEIPGTCPLDLLEARAAAALRIGDDELFDQAITELGTQAPSMARSLLEDLGLDPERIPAPPPDQIEPQHAGGYNDGYA